MEIIGTFGELILDPTLWIGTGVTTILASILLGIYSRFGEIESAWRSSFMSNLLINGILTAAGIAYRISIDFDGLLERLSSPTLWIGTGLAIGLGSIVVFPLAKFLERNGKKKRALQTDVFE